MYHTSFFTSFFPGVGLVGGVRGGVRPPPPRSMGTYGEAELLQKLAGGCVLHAVVSEARGAAPGATFAIAVGDAPGVAARLNEHVKVTFKRPPGSPDAIKVTVAVSDPRHGGTPSAMAATFLHLPAPHAVARSLAAANSSVVLTATLSVREPQATPTPATPASSRPPATQGAVLSEAALYELLTGSVPAAPAVATPLPSSPFLAGTGGGGGDATLSPQYPASIPWAATPPQEQTSQQQLHLQQQPQLPLPCAPPPTTMPPSPPQASPAAAERAAAIRLAQASLATRAVPEFAEWRRTLAVRPRTDGDAVAASGVHAAYTEAPAAVAAGSGGSSAAAQRAFAETVRARAAAGGHATLLEELTARLRAPRQTGSSSDLQQRLACVAYARSLDPVVAAALPKLDLSETLALHLAAQGPDDLDRDAGFRDVPPPPAAGEPAAFARARREYAQRHNDPAFARAPPLRNGRLLAAAPETFPRWWAAVAAACRFPARVPTLWCCSGAAASPQHRVGDRVAWRRLRVAHATREEAAACLPHGGAATVAYRISDASHTAPLAPFARFACESHLLSPYASYTVAAVQAGSPAVVHLVCEGPVPDAAATTAAAEASAASDELWTQVKRLEVAAATGVVPTDEEVVAAAAGQGGGGGGGGHGSQSLDVAVAMAEQSPHAMPRGLLRELQGAREQLRRQAAAAEDAQRHLAERLRVSERLRAAAALEAAEDAARAAFVLDEAAEGAAVLRRELSRRKGLSGTAAERQARCDAAVPLGRCRVGELRRRYYDALRRHAKGAAQAVSKAALRAAVVRKQEGLSLLPLAHRYFARLRAHRARALTRRRVGGPVARAAAAVVAGRYFGALRRFAAGRRRVATAGFAEVSAALGAAEAAARAAAEAEEAALRAEAEGWRRGFWRREEVYLVRKRQDGEAQARAFESVVEDLGPLVFDDAGGGGGAEGAAAGEHDGPGAMRLAMNTCRLAASELRRLRLLVQDSELRRPRVQRSAATTIYSQAEALAELKVAVHEARERQQVHESAAGTAGATAATQFRAPSGEHRRHGHSL